MDETSWGVLGGVVGALVTAVAAAVLKIMTASYQQQKETRIEALAEYKGLVDQLRGQVGAIQGDVGKLYEAHYCDKLLHFYKGKKCSWHCHRVKDEVFFLHSDRLLVRFSQADDPAAADPITLLPVMSFEVPPGLRHQMEPEEESDLFEFSTHHGEDDSIQLVRGD
jgi:hypothetical protein